MKKNVKFIVLAIAMVVFSIVAVAAQSEAVAETAVVEAVEETSSSSSA